MKKLILSLGLLGLSFGASSQVIFSVEEPANIQNFYDFTAVASGWGLPSLTGHLVLDTVKFANDGTGGFNAQGNPSYATGCTALTAGSLDGKIAVVFRGDGGNPGIGGCEFGTKALNCQNAGAVAVIVVNRDESTIAMSAGTGTPTAGSQVTIPVICVGMSVGQAMLAEITAGHTVRALIGDKSGYYNDDLSIFDNTSLRADFGSIPSQIAQDNTELSIPLATMVYNYGINDQTGIKVHATITSGTSVYDQLSSTFNLDSGDSIYVTMPTFSLPTYTAGDYEVSYALEFGVTDQFIGDNVSTSKFSISDSLWSMARLDTAVIAKDAFYTSNPAPVGEYQSCIVLNNPHASRLKTDGMYYGGVTIAAADSTTVFEGQEVNATVFEWDDSFTSTTDATFESLSEVATGSYNTAANEKEATIFIPFDDVYQFEDDQNYLVCVIEYNVALYHAFDSKSIYDQNQAIVSRPRFPIKTGTATSDYNPLGFGIAPAIALHVGGTDLGVAENPTIESSAYPNPSKDLITVKVNAIGDATLKVTDMAGRNVSTQEIKISNGQFTTNVAGMNAGTYVFTLELNNGVSSRFNVVVTK